MTARIDQPAQEGELPVSARRSGEATPLADVGLIGLGNVGMHYADHLLNASDRLVIYDRDHAKMQLLESKGARAASSSKGVASRCNTIVLALPSPQVVRTEMLAPDGILAGANEESLILDMSTIDPDTAKELYEAAAEAGVNYLETPMSGGSPGGASTAGAKAATVSFMVGGDREAFERARPVLDVLGSRAFFLGPIGSGSTVKLISNLIAGLNMVAVGEGFVLGAAAGFSHETLLEVFSATDAKSYTMLHEFAPRICAKDYEGGFPVDLMHKDHRLAGDLAKKLGVPLLFNQLATELLQIARARGYGRMSHAVIVELLASLAGVELFDKQVDRRRVASAPETGRSTMR